MDDPFGFDDDGSDAAIGTKPLLSARLPAPTGGHAGDADPASGPTSYTDLAAISDPIAISDPARLYDEGAGLGGGLRPGDEGEDEEEGEGEETAEEAYRRRQWVIYYVSVGAFGEVGARTPPPHLCSSPPPHRCSSHTRSPKLLAPPSRLPTVSSSSQAEDIGWDGRSPPDPRQVSQGSLGTAASAGSSAGAPAPGAPTHAAPSTYTAQPRGAPGMPGPPGDADAAIFYARPGGKVVPPPAAAPTMVSPTMGARKTAVGWLQQRMSAIGEPPSAHPRLPTHPKRTLASPHTLRTPSPQPTPSVTLASPRLDLSCHVIVLPRQVALVRRRWPHTRPHARSPGRRQRRRRMGRRATDETRHGPLRGVQGEHVGLGGRHKVATQRRVLGAAGCFQNGDASVETGERLRMSSRPREVTVTPPGFWEISHGMGISATRQTGYQGDRKARKRTAITHGGQRHGPNRER